MTKLGDVVFCMDCDRAAQAKVADGDFAPDARRMATKKDANGDPLCTACLDRRRTNRHREFMGGGPKREAVEWQPRSAPSLVKLLPSPDVALGSPASSVAEPPKAARPTPVSASAKGSHEPKTDRTQRTPARENADMERRFMSLAIELGFHRADELLRELRHTIGKATGKRR